MQQTKSQLDLGEPKVEAICGELDLPQEVTQASKEQANRVDMDAPINRAGSVIAASSVYFQCLMHNEKRTQDQVSQAADVAEMSIRECYHEIAEYEGIPIRRYDSDDDIVKTENPDGTLSKLREWFRA